MSKTIALAGKGGVGKTTISALVIKYLVSLRNGPVLAIDADPSSNLNLALGLDLECTVGDIREDMLAQVKGSLLTTGAAMGSLPGGITKRDYLDYQIRSSMIEGDHFDLIAMGRSEGQGCYCAVNHNLREVVDAISKNYSFIVVDNEAGMEHLSRRTTRDVDYLLIISDPTYRGIIAAERIAKFRNDLDIHIKNTALIINRSPEIIPESIREQVQRLKIPLISTIPDDPQITEFDFCGKPFIALSEDSEIYKTVSRMMEKILE